MKTLYKVPLLISVPQAAVLMGMPPVTLYQQVQRGADKVGGRYTSVNARTGEPSCPRVSLAKVLDLAGMTVAEFLAWQAQADGEVA